MVKIDDKPAIPTPVVNIESDPSHTRETPVLASSSGGNSIGTVNNSNLTDMNLGQRPKRTVRPSVSWG